MTTIKQATLPINQLQKNPFQPREQIQKEEITELVESIKVHGILEPLVVAETPAGYQIIAGERRWRAAKEAGLTDVPVHIKRTTPKGMLEMALVENVQRINLNPIERAMAFQRLIVEFGINASTLAIKVSKSPSYVTNTLKLLKLPDAIADGLARNLITEGHARALSSIKDPELMAECYRLVVKERASVRRAEELSRRFRAAAKVSSEGESPGRSLVDKADKQIKNWEENLNSVFHTPAKLKLSRSRNQTRITIVLKGSPEKTQEDLEKIMGVGDLN